MSYVVSNEWANSTFHSDRKNMSFVIENDSALINLNKFVTKSKGSYA